VSGEAVPEGGGRRFEVGPRDAGRRLDALLAARLELSRVQARRLLESGAVRVDGRVAAERDKGRTLAAGNVVEVAGFARPESLEVVPQAELELRVLAEGEGWLVVDKPAGVPVHPLREGETGTVLNAVAAQHPEIQGVGEGGLRSGVVHRLDVETTGTLLFATRQDVWTRMRAAFAEHRTRKVYRAIVLGDLEGGRREVMNLVIAQHKPARVQVVPSEVERADWPAGTRRCDVRWKAIESLRGATLVEVELGTGFLHQIRVMMAQLGHPIAGDALYRGEFKDRTGATRPMLHAAKLEVEEVKAGSAEPEDFVACWERLNG
jgi:23S rRNA pseudouridine1911/1915/1917 synthase